MTPAIGTPAGLSAADVWAAATRTLTGLTGTPRSDLVGSDAALWSHATRKLTNPSGVWDDLPSAAGVAESFGLLLPRHARKTLTLTGGAGAGAVGTATLFTITGRVFVRRLTAFCTESLVSAGGGSISVGVAADVNKLIAATTATVIDLNQVWTQNTPIAGGSNAVNQTTNAAGSSQLDVNIATDIIANILTGAITDGTLIFDVWYLPITDDGALAAA